MIISVSPSSLVQNTLVFSSSLIFVRFGAKWNGHPSLVDLVRLETEVRSERYGLYA
jgi:hypothetical protein